MGLRVRVVLVVLSLLAIAALAIPLALSLADRRTATLAAERDRQLAALADAAAMADSPLQSLVDRYYEVYGEGLLIVDSDGRTLASGGLSLADPGVATATSLALVDAPASNWARILPWDRRHLPAAEGVRRDGELVGAVVLAVDASVAARDVAIAWLWVAVGCLGLVMLAAVVGRALTRWVLRPLNGLERAVAEMTEGVAGPPADVAGRRNCATSPRRSTRWRRWCGPPSTVNDASLPMRRINCAIPWRRSVSRTPSRTT